MPSYRMESVGVPVRVPSRAAACRCSRAGSRSTVMGTSSVSSGSRVRSSSIRQVFHSTVMASSRALSE